MPSKKIRIQFYADENIPIPTVTYLKSLGISIIHAYDKELINLDDKEHLNYSKKEKRVLISLDRDFNKFKNESLTGHPGVILITVGNNTSIHINVVLSKILKHLTINSLKESLIRATINKLVREKKGILEEMLLDGSRSRWTGRV